MRLQREIWETHIYRLLKPWLRLQWLLMGNLYLRLNNGFLLVSPSKIIRTITYLYINGCISILIGVYNLLL